MNSLFEMLMKRKETDGNESDAQLSSAEKTSPGIEKLFQNKKIARKKAKIEGWIKEAMLPVAIVFAALLLRPIRK